VCTVRARVRQPALLASLSIRLVVALSLRPPSAEKFELSYAVQDGYEQSCYEFTRPCACSFSMTYQLPCRHFFAQCLQQDVSLFDDTLIDGRWSPLQTAATQSSQSSVNIVMIQHNFITVQQRFKVASARCNVLASILAELSASRFPWALEWLDQLEQSARSGSWWQDMPSNNAQTSTTNLASTSGDPSTSQAASNTTATQSSTGAPPANSAEPSTGEPSDQGPSQASSALHYPLPVSQRGRPMKRKQRI